MGRPPASAHAVATPERVLEAAERSFAAVGYGSARLADIADIAGIRRPSLLYHFGSKEALYTQTVERCFGRLRRALSASMRAKGDFTTRLRNTVDRYVDFLDAEPQLARIVLRELLDGQGPGQSILVRQVAPLLDVIEHFIRHHGRDVIDPKAPIRAAVLQVGAGALLRAGAGTLREPLWGPVDYSVQFTQRLLLRDSAF